MIVLEIVLESEDVEALTAIAEQVGIGLDMLVVMACRKYVRQVEKDGLPTITGVMLRESLDDDRSESEP
jgi:hypothetical protein